MKHEIKFANGRRTWAEKITPDLITELAEQFDCPVDTIDGVDSMKFMGITQGTKAKQGTITPTLRKSLNKYINEAINITHSNIKEVAITDENLDKELRTKFGEFPMGLLIDLDGDNMFYLKFVDSINMFEVSASEFNNSHLKAKTGTKTGTQKYAVSGGGLAEDYIVEANSKEDAIEIAQASLRPIFGSVPKNRFSVKIVNKVEAKTSSKIDIGDEKAKRGLKLDKNKQYNDLITSAKTYQEIIGVRTPSDKILSDIYKKSDGTVSSALLIYSNHLQTAFGKVDKNKYQKAKKYFEKRSADSSSAKTGTKTGKGFVVFNYTDNIPASPDVFPTKAMANDFIAQFRKRFEAQGYYRDNQWNKIALKDIDLLAIPEDFNTSRKK